MGWIPGEPAVAGAAAHPDALAVGRRIHDLRARRGFTLEEFAALADVPVAAMAALEHGDPTATVSTLCAAVEALEIPLAALLDPPAAPGTPPAPPRQPPANAYVRSVAPAPAPSHPAPPRRRTEPRTFADLRVGPLANRSFATLPEFAVAAVVEGGHPVSVVAKIFRVPSWKLEGWIRDGVPVPRGGRVR